MNILIGCHLDLRMIEMQISGFYQTKSSTSEQTQSTSEFVNIKSKRQVYNFLAISLSLRIPKL